MTDFVRLLAGTVIYRPYVYVFMLCFLAFALRHLRVRGTLGYMLVAYAIAYASEFSATRNGFPFGMYVYVDTTRTRELWLANVPFWDSLSFVFLSYFSWIVAGMVRSPRDPSARLLDPGTAVLGGALMMLLDVVIDPVTLRGEQWMLGRIYYYPDPGLYFGVTLANFAGWFFVGVAVLLVMQRLARTRLLAASHWRAPGPREGWSAFVVYAGVFVFLWGVTAYIRAWDILAASSVVIVSTLGFCLWRMASSLRSAPRRALA